jgi:hypothetical protein
MVFRSVERDNHHALAVGTQYQFEATDRTTINLFRLRSVVTGGDEFAANAGTAGGTLPRHRHQILFGLMFNCRAA